jgi:HPt (histidine-containing phosphotransfer) domain-containing protein
VGPLEELVRLFLMDYPQCMAELQEALNAKDTTRLAHIARTLKGAIGSVPAANATLEGEMARLMPVLTSLTKEGTP